MILQQAENQSKEYLRVNESENKLQKQIEKLTQEVEEERKKTKDFDIVKKQAEQQHGEYMRLSDQYNKLLRETEDRNEDKKHI